MLDLIPGGLHHVSTGPGHTPLDRRPGPASPGGGLESTPAPPREASTPWSQEGPSLRGWAMALRSLRGILAQRLLPGARPGHRTPGCTGGREGQGARATARAGRCRAGRLPGKGCVSVLGRVSPGGWTGPVQVRGPRPRQRQVAGGREQVGPAAGRGEAGLLQGLCSLLTSPFPRNESLAPLCQACPGASRGCSHSNPVSQCQWHQAQRGRALAQGHTAWGRLEPPRQLGARWPGLHAPCSSRSSKTKARTSLFLGHPWPACTGPGLSSM